MCYLTRSEHFLLCRQSEKDVTPRCNLVKNIMQVTFSIAILGNLEVIQRALLYVAIKRHNFLLSSDYI